MIKQYFKQVFYLIKENKQLSAISIIGTALSIAMIMCIVLMFRAKLANYEPEVHRDRTLSIENAVGRRIENEGWNNGGMLSLRVIKECFYPLKSAEAVTAIAPYKSCLATSPGREEEVKCTMSGTDDAFWRIFKFHFLSGKPYGEEFISGEKKAVVSRTLARRIFEAEDVVGQILTLSFVDYTICGVVEDVSVLAEKAYAEVWVPYTSIDDYEWTYTEGLLAGYTCQILAPSVKDIEIVRQEAQQNVERMNEQQKEFKLMLFGKPDTQLMSMARYEFFGEPDIKRLLLTILVVIIVLLLVPAINLSGITLSRLRRRIEEIGVRRVFGSTRSTLVWQVLFENFIITLMGGFIGLIFSYIAVLTMREWLLNTTMSGYFGVSTSVNSEMIVSWDVFLFALLFCLLLNLCSAGIPAWRISRTNIVNALNK